MNKKFFVALMGIMLLASIVGGISVDTSAHHVYGDWLITDLWCNNPTELPGGGWQQVCLGLWGSQIGIHTGTYIKTFP